MSVTAGHARTRPPLLRFTPQLVVLLCASAVLWATVLVRSPAAPPSPSASPMDGMAAMTGTMGLSLAGFATMWSLMMAAMMLPSVAPVASLYARSVRTNRGLRLATFTAGYLAVWAVSAVPGWAALRAVDRLQGHGTWATVMASGVFAAVGLWQLSPLKEQCLRHCRSPFAQLLEYGSYRGALRDLRVALHHGATCLACCWALMAVFVVAGAMNLVAMVVLTAVVAAEKLHPRGELVGPVTGVLALGAAVAVWWVPALAPGIL